MTKDIAKVRKVKDIVICEQYSKFSKILVKVGVKINVADDNKVTIKEVNMVTLIYR